MSKLWDNISIHISDYSTSRVIPYSFSRGKTYYNRILPVKKVKKYVVTKLWCKDFDRAYKLYNLVKKLNRYNKVKIHKTCVYATRRTHND